MDDIGDNISNEEDSAEGKGRMDEGIFYLIWISIDEVLVITSLEKENIYKEKKVYTTIQNEMYGVIWRLLE